MPQIPSRLPREYESPSPDHRTWYTVVVNTVLRYSNVLHLHQRVCHKVGDTMVRTSRFTNWLVGADSKKKRGEVFLQDRFSSYTFDENVDEVQDGIVKMTRGVM